MPSLTIRNLDHGTKERLRVRAARRRHSMEAEARHILRTVLSGDEAPEHDLAAAIGNRFRHLGGANLALPARQAMRPPPDLTKSRR